MPQFLAGIQLAISGFFAATATAFGASAATAAAFAAKATAALGYATTTFIINKAVAALEKRGKTGESRGLEVTNTDSAADGRILYGRVRIGGVNVIPPWTSGSSGERLHQVIAHAIHEVDSYEDTYFDQEQISTASITAVTSSATDGQVTGGKYALAAYIRRYTGTTTQNVDYILNAAFGANWTATARGRGIAYSALTYEWGKGKVYTGVPLVTTIIKGKKCYDPRLDTSPGANPTNASYAAWTSNPALCWADYKVSSYGRNVPAAKIDWASVVTAADLCDALVAIPGATTQKRYTCNGMLSSGNDANDNERKLLDAMMGRMAFTSGKWYVFAGAWQTPAAAIQKEDWLSISTIQTSAPRETGRWNGVRVYYVSPDRNWQRVECYPRENDTYKSSDAGERIWIEMEQPLCTNEYESQRKGEMLLRASRNGIKIAGRLPPKFMYLSTWDTVSVTFEELGWSSKTFRVAASTPNPDGSIELALLEEQSTDWADLVAADYDAPSTSTLPTTNPTAPSAPQNFTVTPEYGYLQFAFDQPTVIPSNTHYKLIRAVQSLATPTNTVVWEGTSQRFIHETDPRSPYYWFVQAIANSYQSAYTPNTFGIPAQSFIRPGQLQGAKLNPDAEFYAATQSYWLLTFANSYATPSYAFSPSNGFTSTRGKLTFTMSHDAVITNAFYQIQPKNLGQIPDPSFGDNIFPMIPGRTLVSVCRWRRVTGVSTPIVFSLTAEAYRYFAVGSVVGGGAASISGINVQATPINEWQTSVVTLSVSNSLQNYATFVAAFDGLLFTAGSGQVEVGELSLYMF